MVKLLPLAVLSCLLLGAAPSDDEKEVEAVVQKLFDAMLKHDAEAARSLALPDAKHVAIRGDNAVSVTSHDQWASRIAESKDVLLERMWNPKILVRGRIAQLWAEYDFHRNGKFNHCGIDSVGLVKTAEGWKVATLSYTMETTNCGPSPLGPPAK